ncbi:MAG: class I SAM-dependent methyltransferase [Pseudomonadota bacterium]
MSAFDADWLSLRTVADDRARNRRLAVALSDHFAGEAHLRILDLGAGTGATMRAVSPLLPDAQTWVLCDNDPALLAKAQAPAPKHRVETIVADLSQDPAPLFVARPDLVTASAFFDLVSAAWIEHFVGVLAAHRVPLYAALSYDGREAWHPAHSLDTAALAAFHTDQRRDKGLGAALGPEAHAHLAECLAAAGYRVQSGDSDWVLRAPEDTPLIAALAAGSAAAIQPTLGPEADVWAKARAAATHVCIGHKDLLAVPR